jgi:hypothetical protein
LKEARGKQFALRPWRPSSSFLSEAQRAFAREVDEPGQKSSGLQEPGSRERKESLHTLTRSASEGVREPRAELDHRVADGSYSGDARGNGERPNAGDTNKPRPSNGALAGASGSGDARPESERRAASVSLTMIVKNEEDHLGKCLESVRRLFDGLASVDRRRDTA